MRDCYGEKYYQEDVLLLRKTLLRCREVLEKEEYKKQISNLIYLAERNQYRDEMSMDLLIKCYEILNICDKIEQINKKKRDDDDFFSNMDKLKVNRIDDLTL